MTEDEYADLLARLPKPGTRRRRTAVDGPRTALGYVRVSSDDQEASGLGLEAQRSAIEAEVERRGWSLAGIVSDVTSGSTAPEDRTGLRDALDDLQHGRAHVLVASRVDRLSRSLLDFPVLLDRARREGWEVAALDLGVDTTTPSGELMAHILVTFAHYERRLIGVRNREALARKKARGERAAGPPSKIPAAVMQRIVSLRESGVRQTDIARILNAEGVPTVRGGREWYQTTVRRALESYHYTAELERNATAHAIRAG
jgi:DNA invertase Pin-like site-specific DNA recombinase